MDPYLERPGLWPDVHLGLISEIQASLNRLVRPKYHVRVEERVYISDEDDPGRVAIVPDLRVEARRGHEARTNGAAPEPLLEAAEPVVITTLIEDEIHEPRLEVVDVGQRAVVTVIEILSPMNKIAGSRGRASFESKRRDIMNSPTHWVEIDLLRTGKRFSARERIPACDYVVHISPAPLRPKGLVWPIQLSQRLPVVPIPLLPPDPEAGLDLQEVLNTAYDRAGYDLAVDYRSEPVPPLNAESAEWAHRLLVERRLRDA
jgi:hypothetical protein